MTVNEPTTPKSVVPPAELELELQEAHARRQRAAELFGESDWPEGESDEDDADD